MDAPKRIWAWPFNSGWHGGYYRENKHAIPEPEKHGSDYILAAEHDRLMAEKDAEIARLLEALDDIAAWMDDPEGPHVGGVRGAKAIARAALKESPDA